MPDSAFRCCGCADLLRVCTCSARWLLLSHSHPPSYTEPCGATRVWRREFQRVDGGTWRARAHPGPQGARPLTKRRLLSVVFGARGPPNLFLLIDCATFTDKSNIYMCVCVCVYRYFLPTRPTGYMNQPSCPHNEFIQTGFMYAQVRLWQKRDEHEVNEDIKVAVHDA